MEELKIITALILILVLLILLSRDAKGTNNNKWDDKDDYCS